MDQTSPTIYYKALMVGLHGAGKSTILYRLKTGEHLPMFFSGIDYVVKLIHNGINMITWDLSTRGKTRPLSSYYYRNATALILVVDSQYREQFEEVKSYLIQSLEVSGLENTTVAIICNKQDLEGAASKEEVVEALDAENVLKLHRWAAFGACGKTGEGLEIVLEWIANELITHAPKHVNSTNAKETRKKDIKSQSSLVTRSVKYIKKLFLA